MRAIHAGFRVLPVRARSRSVLCLAASLALAPMPSVLPAQSAPSEMLAAELFTGFAWNLRAPLVIDVAGDRRAVRAHWSTRPFDDAPYYSYRVARASVGREVAAEMLHHEIYLENPVPPTGRLEVSHGCNEPMLDVAARGEGFRWRFGIGLGSPRGAFSCPTWRSMRWEDWACSAAGSSASSRLLGPRASRSFCP
jgi:hypothetical protein